jgi:GxxExxY protein
LKVKLDNSTSEKAFSGEKYPHSSLTQSIIAAAIEVHKELGPGFLESIYEKALSLALQQLGHDVKSQVTENVLFRGELIGQHRMDLLVDNAVVVELKSVQALASVHAAQLRSTLKAANKAIGLLINFNQTILTQGVKRVIN